MRKGRLQASELAEAVVLSDLTLVLAIAAQIIPVGTALMVVAVVPMAALAARRRLRAVVAGTVAASTVGFLVLGTPVVTSVVACGALGAVVGISARRGYGVVKTVGFAAAFLWPAVSLIIDGLLLVFAAYRRLLLESFDNSWSGLSRTLNAVGTALENVPVLRLLPFHELADRGDQFIPHALEYWWITIPVMLFVIVVIATALAQRITAPTLHRIRAAFSADADIDDATGGAPGAITPAPVPVQFRGVSYRYPGRDTDVLRDLSITIDADELVAIVGPNGSGKSTLARLLAGRRPTVGEITRPGPTGLGVPRGTAIVFQRPELQVLGVRVRDDVVWGMARTAHGGTVDVDGLLDRVGLRAFADRETSTLSGGELQRLAVAAALARRPQLLISDESTAMVDTAGRAQLLELLRSLVTRDHIAVVHVTHRASESASADRVIALEAGREVPVPVAAESEDPPAGRAPARQSGQPLLLLRGVGHVYSRNTPWAHRALTDVNLRIDKGEAVLVVGHNGSGKSTLAWVLAGLLDPSEGDARLEGQPLYSVVGQVGVAFQHSRLQLLRPTVLADVAAASGAPQAVVWQSLVDVGFEPGAIGPRRVDELSGGEARRVVIAGALAARPRALVLDEPFAGLDDGARRDLSAALTRLRTERGMTLICVSHDRDLAPALVDREIELAGGRITYDGPGRDHDDVAQGNRP
jgi:energy-coupling factor transporter ATP-binding protein EcfA2